MRVIIYKLENSSYWYLYDWDNKCLAYDMKFDSRYAAKKFCKKHGFVIIRYIGGLK